MPPKLQTSSAPGYIPHTTPLHRVTSKMAASIPAGLRSADIGRFALRAVQIEKAKPVVAYWCELHLSPHETPVPLIQSVIC